MKKIASIICLAVGLLLMLWSAADFYGWATTGKEILEAYPGNQAVEQLVGYRFSSGLIKVALGLIAVWASL